MAQTAQGEAAQPAHAADAERAAEHCEPAAGAAVDPAVLGGGGGCSALEQAADATGMEVVRTPEAGLRGSRGWARLDEVSADGLDGVSGQPAAQPRSPQSPPRSPGSEPRSPGRRTVGWPR